LHNPVREEFYKHNYIKFTFCVCFNAGLNAMEESKTTYVNYLVSEMYPLTAKIKTNISKNGNIGQYMNIAFLNDGLKFYKLCLSKDNIYFEDSLNSTVIYNHTTYYNNLMLYFGKDKNALLTTIMKNGIIPREKEFDSFWNLIHDKLLAWNANIDFYSEIHR
jgi:hypothetical protein